jgi:HSP20 family molecular chaperone IbpA
VSVQDVDVDADTKASLEHGLLHLHLPKAAKHETEPKGKNIPVM